MIHIYQFFNKPVVNSSMVVLMVHEMLKHQCKLQHGPITFSQNQFVNSSIIVHMAHQMLKQWHRKRCKSNTAL